ncbi:arrestin domain-containing protein 2-like [Ctenocephalides felis]|uniref:arrestin domain-containing protein 2-like n=1 Tax=Ctenocephalides felis TaxID=7515 RepID=UPI000E6E5036|nr:arrestin domain-containing protein 2-like [Ctenocephalides felis]
MPRKLIKFLVLFDNTSLLYFPGQFLSGRVLLELQEDIPTLGLHFHVIGEGVVKVRSSRDVRTRDRENYIDFRMRLLGEPGQGATVLSPGIHSFPFKLGLPLGLPSTFLGKHGWVQYYCRAALREPHGVTHKNQQVFIVMNPVDLNLEPPVLAQPYRCAVSHKVGGVACVGGGALVCDVSLDRGGYVPGETVLINATVTNDSGITIKNIRAALTETIEYKAQGKIVRTERRELAAITRGGRIRPGETCKWRKEPLHVPPLPPTNLRGCHLMDVKYDVYFIIEPKSLDKEVKLQLPIVVATYPLRTGDAGANGDETLGGTLRANLAEAHYPSTLPVFRPWIHNKA